MWEALRHYTLTSSRADQTELTLQLQFDADLWTPSALSIRSIVPFDADLWTPSALSIRSIVPCLNRLGTASDGKPMLTTCTDADIYWFGPIVAATSGPAGVSPWINVPAARTGARLNWVRED